MYDDESGRPGDDGSPFSSFLRQHPSRRRRVLLPVVIVTALVAGGLGWFFLRSDDTPGPLEPTFSPSAPAPPPAPGVVVDSPIDLPAVDTSDAFLRRLVAGLSAHPQFAEWLVTDELAHRLVTTVANLADGLSPAPQLGFMALRDTFRVAEAEERVVVDPASWRRYDRMAAVFTSLDTEGTARLIRRTEPLLEQAHARLGLPDRTFRGDLQRAIANLLAVDVPAQPPELVRGEIGWEYADPRLEGSSSAAKHVIRMGPDNARNVQAKLTELADALGLPRTR